MKKWEKVLADGEWHHFSDIASIYGAGMAHRNGQLERKEEKVTKRLANGTVVIVTEVMFRLPRQEGDN